MSDQTDNNYRINEPVIAQVEQVFPFGVFARLPNGARAYVRKRELTLTGNVDPRQVVSEGEHIKAVVIALAQAERNLELSVRQAEPDPWDTVARSLSVRYTVIATVKKLSTRGVLVQVVPGVDGFIPLAELAPWSVEKPDDLLWPGDHVEAMITHLDLPVRRLRLSIRQQMKHAAQVREMVAFLREKEKAEEKLPAEVTDESFTREEFASLEVGVESVAPDIAERLGRILIVEDHEDVREPLVAWLRRLGFSTEGVTSPAEALACLQEGNCGLALIDLDLSGEDGLNLTRTIAQGTSDTQLAVMSSPEWIAQRLSELTALRVVAVFVKPLDLSEILETLIQVGQGETPDPLRPAAPKLDEEKSLDSHQQLAETMRSGLPLQARFRAGLEELVHTSRAEEGLVFQLDPHSQQVTIVAQAGDLALNRAALYMLVESPVKDVIQERDAVFETHVSRQAAARFSKLLDLLPFESCLGVPIPAGGEVHHALFLFHRQPDAFSRYRVRDAQAMAMLFSVALEGQALEERIRAVSPFLLSGQLATGFSHEVYNKMLGLELQIRNLRADCERLQLGTASIDSLAPHQALDQLLTAALDLKDAATLFQKLVRSEQEERVDVNGVIQRANQLLHPIARRHQVKIETALMPDLPPILGSAIRLQQVFLNVMLNAVQHIAPKVKRWSETRGLLRIITTLEPEKERPIQVRFADNGPGIHHRSWESIFGLGFSTRPGGTGLGLFIARSLVESVGGAICVEQSLIPTGTIFRVELPAATGKA